MWALLTIRRTHLAGFDKFSSFPGRSDPGRGQPSPGPRFSAAIFASQGLPRVTCCAVLYFAYGSNLCESRLVSRAPSARFLGPARLDAHELRFHKRGRDGTAKADAWQATDESHVWGAVAELAEADLLRLDSFEPGYARSLLTVVTGSIGRPAWVYRADQSAVDSGLTPHAWYLDHLLHGGRARGLPAGYLASLSQSPVLAGPATVLDGC